MSAQWPWVKLDDLVEITDRDEAVDTSKTYRLLGVRLEGQGPFLRETVTGAQTSATKFYRVAKGDFIYSRLFAWRGAFGLIEDELDGCHVSNEFPTFTTKDDRLDLRYLKYWFRLPQVLARVEEHCTGSTPQTRNRFKEKFFLGLTIPLPPLSEQRRLVGRIEAVAGLVAEAQALRKEAVEEVEGLLMSVADEAFRMREGWQEMRVHEFCEHPQYGYTESATDQPVGPRFLRITDIQNGAVNWNTVPFCKCPEPSKYLLKPGDLVFARTGATTGKSFVIRDCPEAVFASYLIRLRPREIVGVDYLYWYFQCPAYWRQIADEKKGTGQPNLNGSKLANLSVPVAPDSDQRRIVRELDALQAQVDALKALQAESQAELDALLPAVLAEVFGGQEPPAEAATSKPAKVVRAPAYAEPAEALPMAAEPSARLRRGPGRPATTKDVGQQEAILAYLGSHPGWHGKAAILAGTGVAAGAWNAAINALVKAGKVERVGERKGARYRVG